MHPESLVIREQLIAAGVLVPADRVEPREVDLGIPTLLLDAAGRAAVGRRVGFAPMERRRGERHRGKRDQ